MHVPERRPLPPRVRDWRPFGTFVIATAALAAAWLAFAEPALPEPLRRRPHVTGDLRWFAADTIPFYVKGEIVPDGWVALGDSRIHHGIDERALQASLGAPVAVVWIGGAQIDDLLAVAHELPERRVLVSLSPLSLHRVVRHPEEELQRARETSDRIWPRRLDEALDDELELVRSSLVTWIDPRGRQRGRREAAKTPAQDARQERALAEGTRAGRAAALADLERSLAELRADGREVCCVRLPISPSLRAVEDEAFDPRLFERLCERLAIPYLDLGTEGKTVDGSHLCARSAAELAPKLAEWLRGAPEALRPTRPRAPR